MSSVRFSSRLDTFHHGPPHLFKDAKAVVDSLTDIHGKVPLRQLQTGSGPESLVERR
jgi:hypothetical protein